MYLGLGDKPNQVTSDHSPPILPLVSGGPSASRAQFPLLLAYRAWSVSHLCPLPLPLPTPVPPALLPSLWFLTQDCYRLSLLAMNSQLLILSFKALSTLTPTWTRPACPRDPHIRSQIIIPDF